MAGREHPPPQKEIPPPNFFLKIFLLKSKIIKLGYKIRLSSSAPRGL